MRVQRYGAKYRQIRVSDALAEEWNHPTEIDPRLRLPGLNEFIPEDLSLRCEDPEQQADADANPDFDYRKQTPKLLVDTPKLRMWHKMDRTFRDPKTSIRLQLTSPDIYRSPRSITLNRIFSSVLSDDLNSYVYDASVAGCNYRVSCTPSAYGLSVSGYSEKLPYLLDVVTSRIASLIEEMKEGEGATGAGGHILQVEGEPAEADEELHFRESVRDGELQFEDGEEASLVLCAWNRFLFAHTAVRVTQSLVSAP